MGEEGRGRRRKGKRRRGGEGEVRRGEEEIEEQRSNNLPFSLVPFANFRLDNKETRRSAYLRSV